MATRSAILREHPSGSIVGIYCHWDGSPEHQMPILESRYNNSRLVDKLIHLGDLSSLQTDRNWFGLFQEPNPLPYRDRPQESWVSIKPKAFECLQDAREWFKGMDCEFLYLWVPRQGWKVVWFIQARQEATATDSLTVSLLGIYPQMNTALKITTKTTKAELLQITESLFAEHSELQVKQRILWGLTAIVTVWALIGWLQMASGHNWRHHKQTS